MLIPLLSCIIVTAISIGLINRKQKRSIEKFKASQPSRDGEPTKK